MSYSTPHQRFRRARNWHGKGFTLIELLVVIAIIAVLAGLAFPAVQGALGSGKKAQARNDVQQIAAAVRAYALEYGRLPSTKSGEDGAPEPANSLFAEDGYLSPVREPRPGYNPRRIVFFEAKEAKGNLPKGGRDSAGRYFDPWGTEYRINLDTDYNNRMTVSGLGTNILTVVTVESAGPDRDFNSAGDNISNVK